jgi:hypothetical protein
MGKGLINWMDQEQPDVLCIQEIKASPEQVGVFELEEMGYHHYWYPAQKKGYSGVAIFSKQEPKKVTYGCGIKEYDFEGRILLADFHDVSGVYLDGRDQNCVVAGGEGQSSVWIETPRHYIQFNCTSGRYIHILTQNNTVFYVRCNPSGSTVTS